MIVLIGLGNPGDKYAGHRHNIGFMLLDEIHRRYDFMSWRSKNNAAVAEGRVAATRLILIKPMAYMNKSGLPVKDILGFYKALPQQMIVAHDDIDLNVG
ncbi:MAG: aminoacyl-tRNA hydrolase, partial [Candidatus Puniceispirillales bacterium WSBS_2018_MAG_OTU23]